MHVHSHGDGHSHGNPAAGFLSAALVATLCLVVAEFAGGCLGHSIALTSDAIHNLSDVPTILTLLVCSAAIVARRRCRKKTFGYRRAGILGAFSNCDLAAAGGLGDLLAEAFQRFRHPVPVRRAG